MSTKQGRQSGYTLLELLLYVAVIGTLLTSVTFFFGLTTEARVKNQSISEVNAQGAMVMDTMLQTIHNASSITTPAAAASGASLTLVVPTASLSPTIFSLSSTTLQIKEGASAVVNLTSDDVQMLSLSFKNLTRSGTAGMVQVSFTLARTNPSARNEFEYQKTFTGSAEVTW